MTTFDDKTAAVAAGRGEDVFVLADAKDAEMAFGIAGPGPHPAAPGRFRSRAEYLADMTASMASGDVDLLLAGAANAEALHAAGVPAASPGTALAVRANDTCELWPGRGGDYSRRIPEPLRTADLELVRSFCSLVLYSATFVNVVETDHAALVRYSDFRAETRRWGLAHVLEVFDPASPVDLHHGDLGPFVNDNLVRVLATATAQERPRMVLLGFHGRRSLSELVAHDPTLPVGVVGVSAGTTRDAFELVHQVREAGAHGAMFGRRIQYAESRGALVRLLRAVADGRTEPAAAVREYHEALEDAGVRPVRDLDDDLQVTGAALRHG